VKWVAPAREVLANDRAGWRWRWRGGSKSLEVSECEWDVGEVSAVGDGMFQEPTAEKQCC
jgi:hypothetical protein